MYAVYAALPEPLRRRIAGLRVKHDGTYNSGGYVRQGVSPSDDPREAPGALHPLVYTHPETRRAALYFGRRRNAYIEGLELDASEALLDELWSYTEDAALTWTHSWRVGDLVLWTTAAPCTGATPSTRTRAACCIGRRSRARAGPA